MLVLVAIELALQVRAQLRTGESVFSLMTGRTTYVRHPTLDVRILRPSSVIKGSKQTIETNRYGLRDDDYEPMPPAGERRIALLGASTIMGAYAPTNRQTSSAALGRRLQPAAPGGTAIRVLNAGLNGTTLHGQSQLLTGMLPELGVSLVVWYPGSNDIGCSAPTRPGTSSPVGLPWPALPQWVLTTDIVVKNTAFLRRNNAPSSRTLRPNFDRAAMQAQVEAGVLAARQAGLPVALVTSATAFRSNMSDTELTRRAASSLFFRPCYTGPALAQAIDEFNDALREVARRQGVPLIDMAALLPPEPRYYGDASHFSVAGEEAFAALLASELQRQDLLPRVTAP